MTSPDQPQAPAVPEPAAAMPAEWKPEPRQWQWKDLFTAPMLAFKPVSMLVSALTIAALGGLVLGHGWLQQQLPGDVALILRWLVSGGCILLGLIVFSLGATYVATCLRADLIDDEFLGVGEAVGQWSKRLLPAVLVPVFLIGTGIALNVALLYLPLLVGSIPYAGGAIYALLWPLGFAASVLCVLFGIALLLALFVFPGIIATRQHGWFDNVVDTIEAVGTKPHVLIGGLLLSFAMAFVAYRVGHLAIDHLHTFQPHLPGTEVAKVEGRAEQVRIQTMWFFDPAASAQRVYGEINPSIRDMLEGRTSSVQEHGAWYTWGSGLVAGIWQVLVASLLLGYCLNLMLAGGLLTYLMVREDDYWDDEDLEDLDQLAKELEEEAKREAAGQAPAAPAAPEPPKA